MCGGPIHITPAPVKAACAALVSAGGAGYRMAMSHVIALVDDDRNILTSVSITLQAEGFLTRV